MVQKTLLSVVVPIYNAERYLGKCLQSIQSQRIKGTMEVLCVDDGSSDSSAEIVKIFASEDARFHLISQTNQGRSAARNAGLDAATGEFITFIDADDIVGTPNSVTGNEFQTMIEQMKDGIGLVIGGIEVVHETNFHKELADKSYYAPTFSGEFSVTTDNILRINCSSCAKLFRKQIIDQYKLRYPLRLNYEDAYWWFCYATCIKHAYYVKSNVYTYFRHNSGIMNETFNSKNNELAIQHIQIIERFYQFIKANHKEKAYNELTQRLFETYLNLALEYCEAQDRLYILWKTGLILRKNDVDVEGNNFLSSLKTGKTNAFSFDPSILKDARRWRKLMKILDKVCPQNSLRRRLSTSLVTFLLTKFKKYS